MANLILKVNDESDYRDGDILVACNKNKILTTHAAHICRSKERDQQGIFISSLHQYWLESISEYKFERLSSIECRITRLADGQIKRFRSNEFFTGFNGKPSIMDIPLYVNRRLSNGKKPMFGEKGKEVWYGGKTSVSENSINLIWNRIEQESNFLRKNHIKWPVGNQEVKSHFIISTSEFTDREQSLLTSPAFSEDRVVEKRAFTIPWKEIGLDKYIKNFVDDKLISLDIRDIYYFFCEEIIKAKGYIMVDLQKLKNEIENDPLERGYSNMTNNEIVFSLNAKNRTFYKPLSSKALLAWSAVNGRLRKIKNAIDSPNEQLSSIAEAAYLMIVRDNTELDLNLVDRMTLLNTLVGAGVLTVEDKQDILDVANIVGSRAEELGIGSVFISHVDYVNADSN